MTLGGVEGLNNLAKLKENKFEQLDHEDNYLYLYLYVISNRFSMAMSSLQNSLK